MGLMGNVQDSVMGLMGNVQDSVMGLMGNVPYSLMGLMSRAAMLQSLLPHHFIVTFNVLKCL